MRSASEILRPLRLIKDAEELAILRRAGPDHRSGVCGDAGHLKHGMTTLDLITEVNYQLKKQGSFAPSFQTSFYNMGQQLPVRFSQQRRGDAACRWSRRFRSRLILAAVLDGYCYDFGRSVFFGEPDAEYRRVL